jgi:hypothetical protein
MADASQDCGEAMYGDFDNAFPESVDSLAAALKCYATDTSQAPGGEIDLGTLSSVTNLSNASSSATDPASGNQPPSNRNASQQQACSGDPTTSSVTKTYMELCVNTGELEKRLGEIDITQAECDGKLFELLRERYEAIRSYRTNFFLLKLVDVHYVQVRISTSFALFLFLNNPLQPC